MSSIVAFALRQRWLVVALLCATLAAGIVAFLNLNIEAYPDPVPPLVDVIALSAGQAAEDVERNVTIPIEIQMAGLPHVTAIRTISFFGLSDTNIQFTYDLTYDQAEQLVRNRLSQLGTLANGVQPSISAESPVGEIYRYRVVGPPGYSVTDLKTIEDWMLERRFKAVPGVIDVTSWGGQDKTYDVNIAQEKLAEYGLSLPQVLQALNNSNVNVGGQTVNIGPQSAVVRGLGLIRSIDELRDTMLTAVNGTPVLLRDVATVEVGHQPRLGIAGFGDDNDIVEGVVMMRRGEESLPTIHRVEAEVDHINSSGMLPPGVRVEKIYDRTELINVTTRTVLENMLSGIVLIFILQWVFIGNLRSAVIVAATIPFALSFAIIALVIRGEFANLLSVGAVDFGLIVDATVIMVENIFRHAAHAGSLGGSLAGSLGAGSRDRQIVQAAGQVNRAIFFSAAIIIAGFVPLFTMGGIEGHIFGPMARTYGYAIAGGLFATFTVSPALSSLLLAGPVEETETAVVRFLSRIYRTAVAFALDNSLLALGSGAIVGALALAAVFGLGSEFLPHLEEGNLWIRATLPQSISLEEGEGYVGRMRKLMMTYPEAGTVISQHGRPDDGTDATGFFNAEFMVPLKPFGDWPSGVTKESLTEQMKAALEAEFPGVDFNFSQYIEDNVEEAASGVKGENSVKLYGDDLNLLQKKAGEIKDAMAKVPGITDLSIFDVLGQPTLSIDIDRARAARYGLAPGDINATIQAAIGGQNAGQLYEPGSDRNFPIMVRLGPQYREDAAAIRRVTVGAPATSTNGNGSVIQVPLEAVADIHLSSGAAFIYRENQQRYIPIKFSVRGRDLGGAVSEAQERIGKEVHLPAGYHLDWVGEFGEFEEALRRLAVVVPISMLLIGGLLYAYFGSGVDALLAASAIPMTLVGGIFALFITGTAFSVSAAIGFVALFGIAAMDGIIFLSAYNRVAATGITARDALLQACAGQMRPIVMTCAVAAVGLLPAAVSTGIGSQVQKPLAVVVVGGMALAPLLILVLLPPLIERFSRRRTVPAAPLADPAPAE